MATTTIIGSIVLLAIAVVMLSVGVISGREKSALSRRHCSGHPSADKSRKP